MPYRLTGSTRLGLTVGTCCSVFLLAAVVSLLIVRLSVLMNAPGESEQMFWAQRDFRDAVYYPSQAFIHGVNPYDASTYLELYPAGQHFPPYSPLTLVVHLPFAALQLRTAAISYFALSVALTVALAALSIAMCGRRPEVGPVCLLSAFVLCSRPGHWNALLGQTTLLLVIGTYLAFYFARSRPWLSALGLALVSLKPTFGLPVLVLVVASRAYKAAVLGVVMTGVLTVPLVMVLSGFAGGFGALLETTWEGYLTMADDPSSSPVLSPVRVDLIALVGRFLGQPPGPIFEFAVFVLGIAVAGAAIGRLRSRLDGRGSALLSIGLASSATLVLTYQLAYSALVLVLPITALVFGRWTPTEIRVRPQTRWILLSLLLVPMVNYGASYSVLNRLDPDSAVWLAVASANSVALTAAFCVYVALPSRRHTTFATGTTREWRFRRTKTARECRADQRWANWRIENGQPIPATFPFTHED